MLGLPEALKGDSMVGDSMKAFFIGGLILMNVTAAAAQTATATAAAGQTAERGLVSSISVTSLVAMKRELQTGSAERVNELRREIVAQLAVANLLDIQMLCDILHGFGTEDAVNTLLTRLEMEGSGPVLGGPCGGMENDLMRATLCRGLSIVSYRVKLSSATEQRILKQLGEIMEDKRCSMSLLASASAACGRAGPSGFDLLCKTAKTNPVMTHIFYGALSGSLDPRAARLIRHGIEDPTVLEHARLQAVGGIGSLFAALERAGIPVDKTERTAALKLVEKIVHSASGSSPDQADKFFAAALQSWVKMSPASERMKLRGPIIAALDSSRPLRQQAALELLFASPDLQDDEIMGRVRQLAAQSDTSETGDLVIVTAKDILESRFEIVEDRISRE